MVSFPSREYIIPAVLERQVEYNEINRSAYIENWMYPQFYE